jgi:hypothetical protein
VVVHFMHRCFLSICVNQNGIIDTDSWNRDFLATQASITKNIIDGSLTKNRNLFLTVLEARKSKIKVLAD